MTRHARQRGVCRQRLYREAAQLPQTLARQQQTIDRLLARLRELERQHAHWQRHLRGAVVLDAEKQTQFASVGASGGGAGGAAGVRGGAE